MTALRSWTKRRRDRSGRPPERLDTVSQPGRFMLWPSELTLAGVCVHCTWCDEGWTYDDPPSLDRIVLDCSIHDVGCGVEL